ncbi:MAG: hypothetical protein RJA70_1667, partial [Pseudomonadota bacterium]
MALESFHPAVSAWFSAALGEPTPPQLEGWPAIARSEHTLIAAPTGTGKTLAAFLAALNELTVEALTGTLPTETRVLYLSPLKALSNDIEKNLQQPLVGISQQLERLGYPPVQISTMVRTGDTPAKDRAKMTKRPPHIVVTTPESLFILLTSDGGRRMLSTV